MNPLQEAKRRAADQLSAFLARYPDEIDLEEQLVNLVEATIHKATEGFCRQDPRARESPRLVPTWIPAVPAELCDRLEAAGLVLRDEKENKWVWALDWFGALLGYRALRSGTPEIAAERLESWLIAASARASTEALGLLAEERLEEEGPGSLQPFLGREIGLSALGEAVALRAPADDPPADAAPRSLREKTALAEFTALLDRHFGLPQTLGPARSKFRAAKVLERAESRLRAVERVNGARKLLRRRLVNLLESAAARAPRDLSVLRFLGNARVSCAEDDSASVEASADCARALEIWRRLGALDHEAPARDWSRYFLRRVCACAVRLPQHGDPARFAALYETAFEALAGLQEDPSHRHEELRERVMLLGRAIELEWEANPGDTVAAFERAIELIEQLLELAPSERRYLEGKQEVLEEFARRVEGTDPTRAERLRAEAAALALKLASLAPSELAAELRTSESYASSNEPVVAPPEATASRGVLIGAFEAAWSVAANDPLAAIAASRRIVETLFRSVLVNEMGRPPGRPTFEDIVEWLKETRILPERFHYQLVVLEWHVGMSSEELSNSRVFSRAPGVICCAAMTRFARWYFAEYLQVDLPLEMGGDPPVDSRFRVVAPPEVRTDNAPAGSPVASLEDSPIRSANRASGLRLIPPEGYPPATTHRRGKLSAIGVRVPPPVSGGALIASRAKVGKSPLHRAQEAAAEELGLAPRIVDPVAGIELILIPGGEVWVEEAPVDRAKADGERPWHRAQVRPFYCGLSPILQKQWSRFMKHDPSLHFGARRPVANLTLEDVQAFLARANEGRTGPRLRLLREAEWYRAARAGAESAFWWGTDYRGGLVNCSDDGIGSGLQETSEPWQFPANPFGILDVYGNVWEWIQAGWSPAPKGVRAVGSERESATAESVGLCGGSWKSFPDELLQTRHVKVSGGLRFDDFGFRCGRDAE